MIGPTLNTPSASNQYGCVLLCVCDFPECTSVERLLQVKKHAGLK